MDSDLKKSVQQHCDKHIVSQAKEAAQLLSTALHTVDHPNPPYRVTHINHPDAKYARSNRSNYLYVCNLLDALLQEYTERYGKIHSCARHLKLFLEAAKMFPEGEFTEPPQCMPEIYRSDDTVKSYRAYYLGEKRAICKWRNGNIPDWWIN